MVAGSANGGLADLDLLRAAGSARGGGTVESGQGYMQKPRTLEQHVCKELARLPMT